MTMTTIRRLMLALLLTPLLGVAPAHAAQDYDGCTGYIESLPASIATQGIWCLRGHLYTSQASGAAIAVLTDNVTIDCGHFRVSGYGAGVATEAVGVSTGASRLNATVRRCRIQGFKYGVQMYGAGHLVEDNRFDGNRYVGIFASGDHPVIRNNAVMDTGGRPGATMVYGIHANATAARVAGNTVHGIVPVATDGERLPRGIVASGVIEDNHVAGLDPGATGDVFGIIGTGRSVVRRNTIVQATPTPGIGILGSIEFGVCRDNDIVHVQLGIALESCTLAGQNLHIPGAF